jgi:ubiquitin-like-conjugating enzyme ATG3
MTSVISSLRRAREWAYPQLTKSAFLEKGVLTPEEFVVAGDELVYRCPTWSWEGGDPARARPYLPPDKQYLVTRNVPCQNRVASLEQNLHMENEGGGYGGNDDDEWLVSSIIRQATATGDGNDQDDDALEDEFDILDAEGEVVEKRKDAAESGNIAGPPEAAGTDNDGDGAEEEEEDEYAEMAGYEDDDVLVDDAAAGIAAMAGPGAANDALVRVRTYDVSITYDKYYQTPRVWMTGRDPNDQPLTSGQMMEDVISDYANKTVTMELHPHVAGTQASIHPCQHSKVMKAIVRNLIRATSDKNRGHDTGAPEGEEAAAQQAGAAANASSAQGPSVEMYLFIFLKFVSSMIPTISYDFTMDVTADTSK